MRKCPSKTRCTGTLCWRRVRWRCGFNRCRNLFLWKVLSEIWKSGNLCCKCLQVEWPLPPEVHPPRLFHDPETLLSCPKFHPDSDHVSMARNASRLRKMPIATWLWIAFLKHLTWQTPYLCSISMLLGPSLLVNCMRISIPRSNHNYHHTHQACIALPNSSQVKRLPNFLWSRWRTRLFTSHPSWLLKNFCKSERMSRHERGL